MALDFLWSPSHIVTILKPALTVIRDTIGATKVINLQDGYGNTVQFSLVKDMAHGASATIYKSYQDGQLQSCAVKRIKGDIFKDHEPELQQMLNRERQALTELSESVFITKFFGSYDYTPLNEFWMIMEFCDGGSITSLLPKAVNFKRVAAIAAGVMKALEFIHSKGYIHGDIKCGNILLTSPGLVKVCDFGLASKVRNVRNPDLHALGTLDYMSPEVMLKSIALDEEDPFAETFEYDHKIDIWALGIVVLELLVGNPPLHSLKRHDEDDFSYYIASLHNSRASERGSGLFDLFYFPIEIEAKISDRMLDRERILHRLEELSVVNTEKSTDLSDDNNTFLAQLFYKLSVFRTKPEFKKINDHFVENVKYNQSLYGIIKCLSFVSCCLIVKKEWRPEVADLSYHSFVNNQYREFSALEKNIQELLDQSHTRHGRKSLFKDYAASLTMHEIMNIIEERTEEQKRALRGTTQQQTTSTRNSSG